MKKILTSIIAALALCGAAIAQTKYHVNTTIDGAVMIVTDGTTPISSSNGWVATFWYGGTNPDPTALAYLGAGVTFDYALEANGMGSLAPDYAGGFDWWSVDTLTLAAYPATSYFAMRIFQVDQLFIENNYNGNTLSQLTMDATEAATLWGAASASGADGIEILYSMQADGTLPREIFEFTFVKFHDGKNYVDASNWLANPDALKVAPIPEPSTWLLLGAGAAFVVVMRRRRKQ